MNAAEFIAAVAIGALAVSTIYLILRDHFREVMALDDWPVLTEWEASTEANIVEALALVDPTTPMFDRTIEEHPWVAEQLLAHDLSDDDAVARWLS
jgi:hypothetical protein